MWRRMQGFDDRTEFRHCQLYRVNSSHEGAENRVRHQSAIRIDGHASASRTSRLPPRIIRASALNLLVDGVQTQLQPLWRSAPH